MGLGLFRGPKVADVTKHSQGAKLAICSSGPGLTLPVFFKLRDYMLSKARLVIFYWNNEKYRVATAQGKQGIWKSIFPDRENTGNLPKILKIWFYTGNLTSTQGKFGGEKKIMSL